MESEQDQYTRTHIVLSVYANQAIRSAIAWPGGVVLDGAGGEQAAFPPAILLDLAMPGLDGYGFLDWMQSSWVDRHPHASN